MDAQSRADESTALLALATACVAQAALDYDAGLRAPDLPGRLIEENMWRAIRYGLDGNLIDLARGREVPAVAAVESLLEWTEPARVALRLDAHLGGLSRALEEGNGAQRQWRRHEAGERHARDLCCLGRRDLRELRDHGGGPERLPLGKGGSS